MTGKGKETKNIGNDMNRVNAGESTQANKQIRNFEQKFVGTLSAVFELPYNAGIVVLTIAMWFGFFAFSYSSTGNFNLFPTIVGYMVFSSLVGIIYGKITTKDSSDLLSKIEAETITKLGVISLILNIFMLMGVKIFAFQQMGLYVISPLAIFSFFLMLKLILQNSRR